MVVGGENARESVPHLQLAVESCVEACHAGLVKTAITHSVLRHGASAVVLVVVWQAKRSIARREHPIVTTLMGTRNVCNLHRVALGTTTGRWHSVGTFMTAQTRVVTTFVQNSGSSVGKLKENWRKVRNQS